MAIVTKTRTYVTGDNLPAGYYNADRDEIIAGVNAIDNSQVTPTAGIFESKLLFNGTSGHRHSGGTSGRKVLTTNLDVTGLVPGGLLKVNSGGTAIESATGAGGIPTVNLDYTGMTPGYPLFINGTGDNMETRQILSTDLDPTFLLLESQVTFDTVAGHDHDGVNSKLISIVVPRSYVFIDYQNLIVENNVGANPVVDVDTGFIAIYAFVKIPSVGASIIATITQTDLTPVASITIPAGQYSASAVVSSLVSAGTILQLNVTQVGSTTAGTKLTVTLSGTTV